MLIHGKNLTPKQKSEVLQAFRYRWTFESPSRSRIYSCPYCNLHTKFTVECRKFHPTIAFISDEEWLSQYAFHFVKDGSRLDRHRFCEPVPTNEEEKQKC